MRRDYFTCVFLALIAGALMFVCFKPLYFTYEAIIPRDFTLLERFSSVCYALFFIFFLPFFAAFKKKEWINWGLAAYGLLAYFPLWFYPAQDAIQGDNAKLTAMLGALVLRTIYNVMEAPFAALSKLIGDTAASRIVYWLLPVAIFWPIVFRIVRFYRRAYLSEQLNPMTTDQAAPATKTPEAPDKPEVLGTVITAPVTAQTPADITRKSAAAERTDEAIEMPPSEPKEKQAMNEGPSTRRAGVRAPVRPVHIGVASPEKEKTEALEAGPKKEPAKPKSDEAIELGAPKPKSDEAIPMGAPKPKSDEAIPMPAPKAKSDEAIPMGAPKSDEAIPMGAPKSDDVIPMGAPKKKSDDVIELGAPSADGKEE